MLLQGKDAPVLILGQWNRAAACGVGPVVALVNE